MKSIKDLIKGIRPNNKLVFSFKCKFDEHEVTDHDKKHCRIIAILQLAKDREMLDYVMSHKFNESFKYDKETQILNYTIKFIKERRKYRGDC